LREEDEKHRAKHDCGGASKPRTKGEEENGGGALRDRRKPSARFLEAEYGPGRIRHGSKDKTRKPNTGRAESDTEAKTKRVEDPSAQRREPNLA
jgi:hypothetical protein